MQHYVLELKNINTLTTQHISVDIFSALSMHIVKTERSNKALRKR